MKLTDNILLSCMKKQFSIKHLHTTGVSGKLRGPLLYEKGELPENGWVYVTQDSSFLQLINEIPQETFWIFLEGEAIPEGCAGVILEGSLNIGSVMNDIRKIFEYYEAWEEKLWKIQTDQGRVQELLQASLPIFGNPIMVVGVDFSLHSLASTTTLPKEYRIFESGKEQMDYINTIVQNEHLLEKNDAETPFLLPGHLTGYRSITLNIFQDEQLAYRMILLEYRNPLDECHKDLLEILKPYVQYLLYYKLSGRQRKNETLPKLFKKILTDRTLDYMEASHQLSTLGWKQNHQYLCLVYKMKYLDQRNYTANAICNYMEEHFQHICSFILENDVVTFFNLTLLEMNPEEIADSLNQFIRDSFLQAGYSRAMTGHFNLRRQYVQSCLALDVGSRKNPYMWIHQFNQIAFTYILEQVTKKLPGHMVCHEKLLVLKEIDEANGTEYMKTLRTYLDLHKNAVQSANALFIHRSTFLYRLDKIKEIMGTNLEDPEELLYLSLSFYLLDQEEQKQ